ncbi:hypothetical protein J3459_010973 [Metarhizium acridum]|nr:hypothetical protein J3459_010973 [Metarhizium acridum]
MDASSQVTECMKLLREIRETGEKTIIFSQWTLLLDLLEVAMWHEQFPEKPIRYDGSMSGDERSTAAKHFRDRPEYNVMLVSLRAGNAGLNLTAASRVIIMDPFWNPYIEMQAIDRTYRIGQQKEVEVYRILTQETVEDRIVALQNKKKEIVEAALDETESMKIGRLGVSELKFLFIMRAEEHWMPRFAWTGFCGLLEGPTMRIGVLRIIETGKLDACEDLAIWLS